MTQTIIGRDVLRRQVLRTERVEVPEWGGEIIMRQMSAAEITEFALYGEQLRAGGGSIDAEESIRLAAQAVAAAWVDEEGKRVLTSADDVTELLRTQTADTINRLSRKALEISGLTAAAVGTAAKNFGSSQSVDSGTPSR